jgi:predicted nuclease of predicted toxin-antitoxin system
MKFLGDMNLSPLWVPFLASHGFEAIHWSTVGQPWAPDSEILAFAVDNGYIVFTHDLDFGDAPRGPKDKRAQCNSSPFARRATFRHR